jgi:alpha-L-rhamnosidase
MITAGLDREAAVVLGRIVPLDQSAATIASAVLSATAHGVYEATVNGQPVTDSVLNPGWTSYEWRLRVQQFDVTSLLTSDGNAGDQVRVEAVLGNGRYRGDLGFEGANANHGTEIGFLAELVIRYADGTSQTVVTDPSWSARVSSVPANSLYVGQTIDARLRSADTPALPLRTVEFDRTTLTEHVGPLTTRQETLKPVRIWTSPAGKTLLDFGQNLVGWIRLRATGEPGHQIVLRRAEVLEHDELGTRPLRAAKATDTFILSGGHDVFEPTLTFHGFRYAEITGFPGELSPDDLEAVVVHSAMARTGWFSCSDPRVNQLVSNSVWGQKGNFLDVPTDCPQRDERLGWTGDIADCAAAEAFFSSLEWQVLSRNDFTSTRQAQAVVIEWCATASTTTSAVTAPLADFRPTTRPPPSPETRHNEPSTISGEPQRTRSRPGSHWASRHSAPEANSTRE